MIKIFFIKFCFFIFISFSSVPGNSEDSFWKTKYSLVLTADKRFEGVQLCTSHEEDLKESMHYGDSSDYGLGYMNSTKLIELVVTNSAGEEVTLYVTNAVYNLLYKRVEGRKNPNIFSRLPSDGGTIESLLGDISPAVVPTFGRMVFIKQLHKVDLEPKGTITVENQECFDPECSKKSGICSNESITCSNPFAPTNTTNTNTTNTNTNTTATATATTSTLISNSSVIYTVEG
ncbi:hypothetical protein HWI79_377 [Cryptosporidium felis]|nr:hypothetical protein HWI79_377 [Cryptosporidium felis]